MLFLCRFVAAIVLAAMISQTASAATLYHFIAHDGQYLGDMTCFGSHGIGNAFSQYGSKFSSTAIWNKFSQYGSKFSSLSPYNQFSSTPPVIYDDNDNKAGYLTINRFVGNSTQNLSPVRLELIMMDRCNHQDAYRDPD